MKIYVAPRNTLNMKMLAERLTLTDSPNAADCAIAWKRDISPIPPSRTVMCQTEPPVASGRVEMYPRFRKYHTVYRFDPDPDEANQFDFGGVPYYPYMPMLSELRKPVQTIGAGIYFAGKRGSGDAMQCGYQVIYGRRAQIAETCQSALGGVVRGEGFPESTKNAPEGWHKAKLREIDEANPAFVLAAENCIMPGYVSEKLWDGMLSGRATLYVGALPKDIPPAAYLFARAATPPGIAGWLELVQKNPALYALITGTAYAYLQKLADDDAPSKAQDRFTQRVIDRIGKKA